MQLETKQFGVAVFQRTFNENSEERGAKMLSVGVLIDEEFNSDYEALTHVLKQFAVRCSDGINDVLVEDLKRVLSWMPAQMETVHGGLLELVELLQVDIYSLWKYVLLQKRVMIYGHPPVKMLCQYANGARLLGAGFVKCDCLYNVSLNDIANIKSIYNSTGYIACTTDKLFQSKNDIYDVFVNNDRRIVNPAAGQYLVNSADSRRLQNLKLESLMTEKSESLKSSAGPYNHIVEPPLTDIDVEMRLQQHFSDLNASLLTMLNQVSTNSDSVLKASDLKSVGLDVQYDVGFVLELAAQLEMKLTFEHPKASRFLSCKSGICQTYLNDH